MNAATKFAQSQRRSGGDFKRCQEYADQTIKTMNKHGMTVKELEKQRSAIRDKMNKRQEKLSVQAAKPKAHKAQTFPNLKSAHMCAF